MFARKNRRQHSKENSKISPSGKEKPNVSNMQYNIQKKIASHRLLEIYDQLPF